MIENLYFLRHGETELNRQFRIQGRVDEPLNNEGREQLRNASAYFSNVKIDRVMSSPLSRAMESAKLAIGDKTLEIEKTEWLMEINHGKTEGMNREELEAAYPGMYEIWNKTPDKAVFPDGETISDVAERVQEGLLELLTPESRGAVLLVTHQIVSGVARCLFLGLPLSQVWENKLVNGDYFHFQINRELVHKIEDYRISGQAV